jgi:CubicO group peptidase (beta-lactamase class C family)
MRKNAYQTAKPEELSVSTEAIKETIRQIREVNNQELHSFLMLRKGTLIYEDYFRPGEAGRLHVLYSVSKSFTSTAIGLAQAQGLLSVEDKLYDFFPEHKDLCDSDEKRKITLAHMLMMGSGFENNERDIRGGLGSTKTMVEQALAQPVIHEPGTYFDYYTLGTYLISAAFSKVCPEGIHSYLRRKILDPMGFGDSQWNVDDFNVPMGGYGMYLTAYDMTRLGQLYLQKGKWEGQRLLPKDYVKAATSKQINNDNHPSGNKDWMAGYGYQFWRCTFGGYRADGANGQYIVVLPDKDAVVVMTSYLSDMQKPLTAVADILLPEIK